MAGYYGGRPGSNVGSEGQWIDEGRGPPFHGRPAPPFNSGYDRPIPRGYPDYRPMDGGPIPFRQAPARINPSYHEPNMRGGRTPEEDETPNDCEIVLTSNTEEIGRYVDMVEVEIRKLGLRVDVIVPREHTKLTNLIDALAKKGTTFAIIVKPDNLLHKSLSVHVLKGPSKPQEHRNMPMEEAFALMQKCFRELRKQDSGTTPERVKVLLSHMLDDRCLTDQEYATLIAFIQDKRRRQVSLEPGESEKVILTTEELQKKILAIICEGVDEPVGGTKEVTPKML